MSSDPALSLINNPDTTHKKAMFRWLAVGGLFLLFMIVLLVAIATPGMKPVLIYPYEPPILQTEAANAKLGPLNPQQTARHTWIIYNVGGKHLKIGQIKVSCDCLAARLEKSVIAPGGFTRLEAKLDLSKRRFGKHEDGGDVGFYETIRLISNDGETPNYKLSLSGELSQG